MFEGSKVEAWNKECYPSGVENLESMFLRDIFTVPFSGVSKWIPRPEYPRVLIFYVWKEIQLNTVENAWTCFACEFTANKLEKAI